MIRTGRRIKRNQRLVTLVPCVAAALCADQGQQTYEDLFPNAKLIEHLPSDAARVPRQGKEQMLRTHEALFMGFRFRRGLHDHTAGPWGQRIQSECQPSCSRHGRPLVGLRGND